MHDDALRLSTIASACGIETWSATPAPPIAPTIPRPSTILAERLFTHRPSPSCPLQYFPCFPCWHIKQSCNRRCLSCTTIVELGSARWCSDSPAANHARCAPVACAAVVAEPDGVSRNGDTVRENGRDKRPRHEPESRRALPRATHLEPPRPPRPAAPRTPHHP